jgi:hypothetical protein
MIDIVENKVLGPAIRNGILKGEATMLSRLVRETVWKGSGVGCEEA